MSRIPSNEFGERRSAIGRLLLMAIAFVVLELTVFGRLLSVEVRDGAEYCAAAVEPIVHDRAVPAMRGRILSHDGVVLAYDRPVVSLAVNYRWLEEPADPRWLRRQARLRLPSADRRKPARIAEAEQQVLEERAALVARLSNFCNLTGEEWQSRAAKIQRSVESIAASVNSRHAQKIELSRQATASKVEHSESSGIFAVVGRSVVDALFAYDTESSAARVTIAEEVTEHVIFEGLSLEAIAEIDSNTVLYSPVKLVRSYRRAYPEGELAAHSLGYLSTVTAEVARSDQTKTDKPNGVAYEPGDLIGRSGIERRYESALRAHRGLIIDHLDVRGQLRSSTTIRDAVDGSDLVLTIDATLQRFAQSLLDQSLARRLLTGNESIDRSAGGAILVLDIHDGAILAAASAPRFNPNSFMLHESPAIESWLNDPARPLFDRNLQMALPPGSVFKIISAAATLDSGVRAEAVECQGFLRSPDALRCAIFRHQGIGHGPVTLADALARSCNVYFFHRAQQLGGQSLLDWADRFGLGSKTAVDLPGEVQGSTQPRKVGDKPQQVDALQLAIGQGPLTVTPLQMARVIAAIGNGGLLVSPHVTDRIVSSTRNSNLDEEPTRYAAPREIPRLTDEILAPIRKGLIQAVVDEDGTAHSPLGNAKVPVAGKTGTAENGGGRPEHSWFVGYAPADRPSVAFVVVIEYAGNASTAVCPAAKLLVDKMTDLGYFSKRTALR